TPGRSPARYGRSARSRRRSRRRRQGTAPRTRAGIDRASHPADRYPRAAELPVPAPAPGPARGQPGAAPGRRRRAGSDLRPYLLVGEVDLGHLQFRLVKNLEQLVAVELAPLDELVGDPLDRHLVMKHQQVRGHVRLTQEFGDENALVAVPEDGVDL